MEEDNTGTCLQTLHAVVKVNPYINRVNQVELGRPELAVACEL